MSEAEVEDKKPLEFASAAEILNQDDLAFEDVDMSKFWPGFQVRIIELTGQARDEWESFMRKKGKINGKKVTIDNLDDMRPTLIQLCAVNEDRSPMFAREDVIRLNKKNSKAIEFLFERCQELNKLNAKDVEESIEDFEIDLNGESGSN